MPSRYYRHVYELMLRLRLNTLWPAMHEGTTSFNAATDTGMYDAGPPVNAREAAEYGVVMSSSHAELMLRSNVEEWRPFYDRNKDSLDIKGANYQDAFDYSINKPAIIQYWRERLVAADADLTVRAAAAVVRDPPHTPGRRGESGHRGHVHHCSCRGGLCSAPCHSVSRTTRARPCSLGWTGCR